MLSASRGFAEKAASRMAANGLSRRVALDPATILVIVTIIAQVATMLRECQADKKRAAEWCRNPGIWGRLRLWSAMNRAIGFRSPLSSYRLDIREAVLDTAREISEEEVAGIMAEAAETETA